MTRYGLVLSAHLIWLLYIFLALTFVLAFPIAAILDKVLGEEEGNIMTKSNMKRLFEMYEREKWLNPSERKILSAALELHERRVKEVMTPLDKTFMLDVDLVISRPLLREIYEKGYSRVPIYENNR